MLHARAAGRNLERIADHAVIIGERVSYMVTGDRPRGEDPVTLTADAGTTVLGAKTRRRSSTRWLVPDS